MKKHLFYTFLSIFAVTAAITLAGITKLIFIEDFYLKGLFATLIIELVGAVIGIYKNTDFFDDNKIQSESTPKADLASATILAAACKPINATTMQSRTTGSLDYFKQDTSVDSSPTDTKLRPSPITVEEIVKSINSAPPLQRQEIEQKYNGILVDWSGFLKTAERDWKDNRLVRVNMTVEPDDFLGNSIWFTVDPDVIPEMRILQKGSHIRIIGEIIRASGAGLCVTVRAVEVSILSTAKPETIISNA